MPCIVSDIGGAAGLIAGMTLATFCGVIDFTFTILIRNIKFLLKWLFSGTCHKKKKQIKAKYNEKSTSTQ